MFPDTVQQTIEVGQVGRCAYKAYVTEKVFPAICNWLALEKDKAICVGLNEENTCDCVCVCLFCDEKQYGFKITQYETMAILDMLSSVGYARTTENLLTQPASCEHRTTQCTPTSIHNFMNSQWCCGIWQGKTRLCFNDENGNKDKVEISIGMAQILRHALATTLTLLFAGKKETHDGVRGIEGRLEMLKTWRW